jgi:uncharacterized damage-inducible protein DinB
MTNDQATAFLNLYLPLLKREAQTTKRVLEAVPADKASYRPDPVSMAAMELVHHVATTEHWFAETVLNGVFNPGPRIPESAQTPAAIAAWYETECAKNHEALAKVTPEQLLKVVDFRGIFAQPAMMFLTLGMHHGIHHRGQLSAYLRSMGAKVPAIYGDSADSKAAKQAS